MKTTMIQLREERESKGECLQNFLLLSQGYYQEDWRVNEVNKTEG